MCECILGIPVYSKSFPFHTLDHFYPTEAQAGVPGQEPAGLEQLREGEQHPGGAEHPQQGQGRLRGEAGVPGKGRPQAVRAGEGTEGGHQEKSHEITI